MERRFADDRMMLVACKISPCAFLGEIGSAHAALLLFSGNGANYAIGLKLSHFFAG
jgi:hypothetical protein